MKLWFPTVKNMVTFRKEWDSQYNYIYRTFWFSKIKTMVLYRKLWNSDLTWKIKFTIAKTMEQYRKLRKFDLLWKNYGAMVNFIRL